MRRIGINKLVELNDEKSIKKVLDHYSNMFYNKISNFTEVLNDQELRKFSNDYIAILIDKVRRYEGAFDKLMVIKIADDVKALNEEKLLMYYCICTGVNNKVLNYFYRRYHYLLDYYVGLNCHAYLSAVFKDDLKDILSSIKRVSPSVKTLLEERLKKRYGNSKTDYDMIRKNVYNHFKDSVDHNVLLALIDEEISENLKRFDEKPYYLKKRSVSFKLYYDMKKYLLLEKTKEDNEASIIIETQKNVDLLKRALLSFNGFYPNNKAYYELYCYYESQVIKFYTRKRAITIKKFILESLLSKVQNMNDKYGTQQDVWSLKKQIMESSAAKDENFSLVYDNWVNYYMTSYPLMGVTFKEFVMMMLASYDKANYDDILEVKSKKECLVLKR